MRTFWKHKERMLTALRRQAGLLMLAAALALCTWVMTDTAYAVKPSEPTYLFEVSTGATTATHDEKKIDFFIITYSLQRGDAETDAPEKTVSKFLFPSKDAWTQTYDLVKNVSTAQADRDKLIRSTYGYSGAAIAGGREGKAVFQAYSTDQYLFTTPDPIKEIKRVQVFASDNGSWACQGMRVFRVDDLGGLFRWNDGSSEFYIDFEGELIAESSQTMDLDISWTNDRLVSTKSPEKAGNADITLKTSGLDPAYVHHASQKNENKTLAMRLDFADTFGAGFETNAAMSTTANTLKTMGITENMAVTLYYTDIYGMRRSAKVAALLNGATFAEQLLGDGVNKPIGGFAQQGEGFVFPIFLPDYASLSVRDGITVTLGGSKALEVLGMAQAIGNPIGEAGELRATRAAVSENDAASIVTMAIYDLTSSNENGEPSVRINASVNETVGAIRYTYIGDPLYYQPVSSSSGNALAVGDNRISLATYEHGKLLAPRDKTDRYLFEIKTDDIEGAGTKDDIMMRVRYRDLRGVVKTSEVLNVRELSRDYNGMWHGSAEGVKHPEDIAYYKGVASGQSLKFFVSMTDVKTIENIEVWLPDGGNHDDWQMSDLVVSTLTSNFFEKRAVIWEGFSGDGVTCKVTYDRTVDSMEIYRFKNTTDGNVLIQQGADTSTDVGPNRTDLANGEGADVTSARRIDWSEIRYAMNFQQASQDLGFGKQRFVYAVTVNVGGSSEANAEDGDCGSKNLFYFRLIFKNGSSGFVLANQQLASDGFIAGAAQTFQISTNQDYGDVTAVQIIPEEASENADVFDKLKIQSIEVTRQSNAALVPVWTIGNVGWISIDYRDQTQLQSITGMAGRGAEDLTRSYSVDGSTFKVNFMVSIQTEGYPPNSKQFTGNLAARINYDSYSPTKGFEEIADVTKSIYEYMNRTPIGSSESIGGKTMSDPTLMHRAGHTDRFYFSLSDVRSIRSIDFQITSSENTIWKISSINLFMVNGEGTLALNKNGEYERVYRKGEELTELAHGTSPEGYPKQVFAYDKTYNTQPVVLTVNFTENEVPISPEARQWTSIVSRQPVSENDTLNLFVYPLDGAELDPTYSPVGSIQYTDASDQAQQVSTGDLNRVLYNDKTVFYKTGISAKRFGVLNNIVLYSGSGKGISGSVRAVAQQVRSGVVINSWDLAGTGTTSPAGIVLGNRAITALPEQHVQLQIGADTETKVLNAVEDGVTTTANNLAAAIYYRADDPSGMELRSPYVYLTDQGYTKLKPGQVIDLLFEEINVAEITGVALVSTGEVVASVDAVNVVNQEVSTDAELNRTVEVLGEYSAVNNTTVMNAAYRLSVDTAHIVKPLNLTFNTAVSAADDVSAGTGGPVRMTLAYFDTNGDLITKGFEDIRPYISDGSTGFQAGSKVNVKMLLSDPADLRWIELEPYSDTEGAAAMWTLESLTVTLGEGEGMFTKNCDVKAQIVEGTPMRMNMADILVTATVQTTSESEGQVVSGGSLDLLISSGESIRIIPKIVGSYDGFTATLVRVDTTTGAVGRANLDDTRGYTAESIAEKAAAASDSREKAIWNNTKPQTGSFDVKKDELTFTPPRNYTDKSMQYQIKIVSNESESSVLTLNVTVENESNPVTQQLEELSRIIDSEKYDNLQKQIDNINTSSSVSE